MPGVQTCRRTCLDIGIINDSRKEFIWYTYRNVQQVVLSVFVWVSRYCGDDACCYYGGGVLSELSK